MRKYYLDNLRYGIVLLVVVYHAVYNYNSVGVINNLGVKGIPQLDAFLYLVNPWFMALLFLISGIGARHFLQKKTGRQFIKDRALRLLLPSIAGVFIYGWITGYITTLNAPLLQEEIKAAPGFIKYLIFSSLGIGVLWFAQELFLVSMVLLLIRTIDKKDKLWKLAGKANTIVVFLMFFAVWGSSYILNTPFIEVYRHGIYLFMFLLGYYLFSHEEIIDRLGKYHILLFVSALTLGGLYTFYYYGSNYVAKNCLQSLFTNLYAWIMILALLGCGKIWWNKNTKFSKYMAPRSFTIYVLHCSVLVPVSYVIITYFEFPWTMNYIIPLLITIVVIPLLYEILSRIPILRVLILGKASAKIK